MTRRRTNLVRTLIAAALLCVSSPVPGRADLVYFLRGGKVQLPVTREGKRVFLEAPDGRVEFRDTDFAKIVSEDDPAIEWLRRDSDTQKAGPNERFAAAWWALENGLTDQAVRALREVYAAAPQHEPTASLIRTLDRVTPALADPDSRDVGSALRGSFREARSPHFLLFHKGSEAHIQERLALLEKVYSTFYLVFAGHGFDLKPPKTRLMGAIFASQQDYLDFLNRGQARAFATTQGYYHPTLNLVVSFDPVDVPTIRNGRIVLDRRSRQLAEWQVAVDRMPTNARAKIEIDGEPARTLAQAPAKTSVDAVRRDLARQTLLLDLERRSIDLGMAAHETTHQLVANSGLTPHHDDFPTWLHEGIASQFEVVRGGRWAGVSRAHDLRLPEWRSIYPAPHLVPLVRNAAFGHGYDRDLYAQAWALVYYLRKSQPKGFATFLDVLRSPSSTPPDRPARLVEAFRTSFGEDLSKIEVEWHRFMKMVKTPLEDGTLARPAARQELPSRPN